MDRSRFLIGAFGYNDKILYSEEKFKDLIDFGTDYSISANADLELIALCEKYNMPMLTNDLLICL